MCKCRDFFAQKQVGMQKARRCRKHEDYKNYRNLERGRGHDKKTGLELAIEDLEHGRISPVFTSVDEMFKSLEN